MEYYIKCPITQKDAQRVSELVREIRNNPSSNLHKKKVVNIIHCLSENALDYFFMFPIEIIKVGKFGKKMSQMGIKSGLSVISRVSKKIFDNLSEEQLLKFADYLESLIIVDTA